MDSAATESVVDLSATESADDAVHRVDSFDTAASVSSTPAAVQQAGFKAIDLPDPELTSTSMKYRNFSTQPLFSRSGPKANDVRQGAVGDCYFLAVLSSIAKTDPGMIRRSVASLGDGTYAVQFVRAGRKVFVRVDADLPTWGGANLAYAAYGAQQSIWVPILEKAFAIFRTGQARYASIAGGWMTEVYAAFGRASTTAWKAASAQALLQTVKQDLAAGQSVTWGVFTVPKGAPLISGHAYSVDSVVTDSAGNLTGLRLRNPWGTDGAGNDGANDGYVTLTPTQALAAFTAIVSALV
jgi:hypothetical protein